MSDTPRPAASKAVFLSYTSEDLAVALAVCEALRESGIEVWMDQSELQGGDAWDENIQRQIRECALIIPIISARTQARREGYFRLEWRLADERMRLVAEGTPLLLPVVADDTRQADALVPKSFLTVQWSRLPHGNVPPAFVVRVRKVLGFEPPGASTAVAGDSSARVQVAGLPPPTDPAGMDLTAPDEPTLVRRTGAATARSGPRGVLSIAVTAVIALLAGVLADRALRPAPKLEPKPLVRFAEDLPPNVSFRNTGRPAIALAPDGSALVYNTAGGLFLRTMEEMNAHVIPGTEDALTTPVFAPDGQSVAFYSLPNGELRRISINGGTALPIGRATNPYGMSWERDGSILYGQEDGIWRVPAGGGGKPERIIPAEAERLTAPQLLPDGKTVLFSSVKFSGAVQVEVRSLSGGERKVVVSGGRAARYLPATGHLLYFVEPALFGVAFDVAQLATIGNPASIVPEVRLAGQSGLANYTVSQNGTLLYLTGATSRRVPTWVDRQGKEAPLKLDPGLYATLRLSPDGSKIVFAELIGFFYTLAVWDLAGETRTRLTLGETGGFLPQWSLDGTRIVYSSNDSRMMMKPANNTRPPEILVNAYEGQRGQVLAPLFFTPDGRNIVFSCLGDIGMMPVEAPGKPAWLFNAPKFNEQSATLSPDGKWIAYESDESGRPEIYVSPFPKVEEDRVVVSTEGGSRPLWSPDGRELFYLGGTGLATRLMAAAVQSDGKKFTVVSRNSVWKSTLQELGYYFAFPARSYDISPDNQRFLMLKNVRETTEDAREQILIVQNWTEELKRRVPGGRK